ncbi:MAG TPA: sortase [Candidatus Saccharimonadales bacterium]|nr:sortase [Candidatus Saccharimonadales bacterium]
MLNPLFSSDDSDDQPKEDKGYVVGNRHSRTIQPLSKGLVPPSPAQRYQTSDDTKPMSTNAAVELIRRKVEAIYGQEPPAKQEIKEAKQEPPRQRSKHQQFMYELSTSGKPLAQIQTEWHNYYVHLPDNEKHEVWREFYANNNRHPSAYATYMQQPQAQPVPALAPSSGQSEPIVPKPVVAEHMPPALPHSDRRSAARIRKKIVHRVLASESAQQKAKQHFKSLLFGISTGAIVLIVFLFSFFNEMIIAPFIQPSRHVSATPIILSTDSTSVSETPEVIIPKINVQIPVIYDPTSVKEEDVQRNLEDGVIHYAATVTPGQQGNAAFFGHSSNNLFNKGKYKFAFVLLHELVPGDIFYLTYNKTIYTYRVFDKRVVAPTEISVLNNVLGKTATATLITCDPPGTSNNRLVVWGEQISPDPAGAAAPSPASQPAEAPTELTSNGPTLWSRFWNWAF